MSPVQAEALTRNVGAFSRFLEVAAPRNGQVANVTGRMRGLGAPLSKTSGKTSCEIRTADCTDCTDPLHN
jgi:hypothetical protein